ncbi:hypothetical protein [Streptomyces sp. NPDC004014]
MLGPAGHPLTGRLQALLDDPAQAPSAVLGLLAVADPAGHDRVRLTEAVLRSVSQPSPRSSATGWPPSPPGTATWSSPGPTTR